MVVLINYESPFFDKEAARELFEVNKELIEDRRGFESYLTRWFFNVYNDRELVGCLFCYHQDAKDWVGGFAKRKRHYQCLEALNRVKVCFPVLYAETKQNSAKFILKKAGFEHMEPDIWRWRR